MKISFVVPCYYSEKTLASVTQEIMQYVEASNTEYELILVNDGSKDETYRIITELAHNNSCIKGINLSFNTGQHNAIMAGLNYCTGDYTMILTDDGQTPLEMIPELVAALQDGLDAVCIRYTSREKRKATRKIGTMINSKISNWLIPTPKDVKFTVDIMMKDFVVKEIIKYKGAYSYLPGLLFRITQNVGNVEAEQKKRLEGSSGYTMKKLLDLFMSGFTAFSVKPLRISAKIGFGFSFLGFVGIIYLIIRKIIDSSVQMGWSSIMAVLLLASGMVMIILGLIGEYVGRIYMCINNSPQYVVKNTINIEKKEKENA